MKYYAHAHDAIVSRVTLVTNIGFDPDYDVINKKNGARFYRDSYQSDRLALCHR